MKRKPKQSTTVTLRQKQLKGNKKSLYLDFYPPVPNLQTGKATRREFLDLFVFSEPATPEEKAHNMEALMLARRLEKNRQEYYNRVRTNKENLKEFFLYECAQLFEKFFYKLKYNVKP